MMVLTLEKASVYAIAVSNNPTKYLANTRSGCTLMFIGYCVLGFLCYNYRRVLLSLEVFI